MVIGFLELLAGAVYVGMATLGVESVLTFQVCDIVIDFLKLFLGSPPFKFSKGGASTLGGLARLGFAAAAAASAASAAQHG